MGDNIKIRSDLSAGVKIPEVNVKVRLPDPLKHLLSVFSSINDMPNYNTQADASIDVLRQVRENSNNYHHRQHFKIKRI